MFGMVLRDFYAGVLPFSSPFSGEGLIRVYVEYRVHGKNLWDARWYNANAVGMLDCSNLDVL